jgi:hypothetical protein
MTETTFETKHEAFWHDLNGIRYHGQAAPAGSYRIKVQPDNYAAIMNVMNRPEVAQFKIRDASSSGAVIVTFKMQG